MVMTHVSLDHDPTNMPKRPRTTELPDSHDPEVDPSITLESPPGDIVFRLLAPVKCPKFVNGGDPGPCLPRVSDGVLMTCPSCRYTAEPSRWLLDSKAQRQIFESISEDLGRGPLVEMMAAMGSEVDHEMLKEPRFYTCDVLERVSLALRNLERQLWLGVVGAIDRREIVGLIRRHHHSLQDCYVLHDVTDFVFKLMISPADEAPPILEIIQSGEGNTESPHFTRAMQTIIVDGYLKYESDPESRTTLAAAITEWRDARIALHSACAFTQVCHAFLKVVVRAGFSRLRKSYERPLGKYVASQIKGFDH